MILNCNTCRKPFSARNLSRTCPTCVTEEKEHYHRIYQFLLKRPGSSMDVISEETGIPKDRVLKLFKEGKFSRTEEAELCLSCRKPLSGSTSKGLCQTCVDRTKSQLMRSVASQASAPAARAPKKDDGSRRYGLGT